MQCFFATRSAVPVLRLFFRILQAFGLMLTVMCANRTPPQQAESCLNCHSPHPENAHANQACITCHGGDPTKPWAGPPLAEDALAFAHRNLIPVPGNLSNAEITCGKCHASQFLAVKNSLMTTNIGMIGTTRSAFGEKSTGHETIHDLRPATSAADSYFSQLCSSCHLGLEKSTTGPTRGYEKGGGCLACHLNHEERLLQKPVSHIVRRPGDEKCFLCHSRSNRISLNYAGLGELYEDEHEKPARILPDGRKLKLLPPDVHSTKHMACVDCHGKADVMGDGNSHQHREQAVHIRCEDCHKTADKRLLESNPTQIPRDHSANHARLSCTACHTAWAPNCFGCHINYKKEQAGAVGPPSDAGMSDNRSRRAVAAPTGSPPGHWVETPGETFYRPPALGVTADGTIRPFLPGMKLTIDVSGFTGRQEPLIHRVLYAPSFPHTISKTGRGCKSCHNDPYALGFGDGKLTYSKGTWTFVPAYRRVDGLPEDAWILPFQPGTEDPSLTTRPGARPLNAREQSRILAVGRCLECHDEKSKLYLDYAKNRGYHRPGH